MRTTAPAPPRQTPVNTFAAWWDQVASRTTLGRVRYMLRNSWTILRASPNGGGMQGLLHFLASKTKAQLRRYTATETIDVQGDSGVRDIYGCWMFREPAGESPRFEIQIRVDPDTHTSRGIQHGVPCISECNVFAEVNGQLVRQ